MQTKLVFTRKVVHLASLWKWGFLELGSGLFTTINIVLTRVLQSTFYASLRNITCSLALYFITFKTMAVANFKIQLKKNKFGNQRFLKERSAGYVNCCFWAFPKSFFAVQWSVLCMARGLHAFFYSFTGIINHRILINYRKIPKISPSMYKPPKIVTQKTLR